MPCLSVIVPVHNTVQYLDKCVQSILSQTLEDIEIILSENMSTDGSSELCDALARTDERIKVLHLDKAGPSYARNRALEISSGEYVGYVDSDDYIEKDMYQILYDAAVRHDADVVYCNFRLAYPDEGASRPGEETLEPDGMPSQRDGESSEVSDTGNEVLRFPAEVITDIFTEKVSSSPCTKIFRRQILDKQAFPEDVFFEDHAVVYKMIAECSRCVWVDRSLYWYFQRPGSTCHTLTPKKEFDFFMAESSRLNYLDRFDNISQETKDKILGMQITTCWSRFRSFMKMPGAGSFRKECNQMRDILVSVYGKRYLLPATLRKAFFKIRYFWPIYRMTHLK